MKNKNSDPGKARKSPVSFLRWILLLVLAYFLLTLIFPGNKATKITYDQFRDSLEMKRVAHITLSKTTITGKFKEIKGGESAPSPAHTDTTAPVNRYLPFAGRTDSGNLQFKVNRVEDDELLPLLEEHNVTYQAKKESGLLGNLLIWILPLILLIFL